MPVLIFVLIVEIAILHRNIARNGFFPFPHTTMVYIVLGQIAISIVAFGWVKYAFLDLYSTYTFVDNLWKYLLVLFGYFLLLWAICPRNRTARFHFFEKVSALLRRREVINIPDYVLIVAAALCLAHLLLMAMSLNWQVVWSTSKYLAMGTTDALVKETLLSVFGIRIFQTVGLVSCVLLGISLARRSPALLLILPVAVFHVLYQLSSHSRFVVVDLVAIALPLFIYQKQRGLLYFLVALMPLFLLSSLGGRNSGEHGFSSLANIGRDIFKMFGTSGLDPILNIFEGIFVSSEMFVFDPDYPTIYKVLSFSPFPAFIDQFDDLLEVAFVGLHPYVPASAWLEANAFGPGYLLFLIVFQLVCGKLTVNALARSGSIAALLANFFVLIASYLQFAYPIRNIFRLYILALACLAISAFAKRFGLGRAAGGRAGSSASDRPAAAPRISPRKLRNSSGPPLDPSVLSVSRRT